MAQREVKQPGECPMPSNTNRQRKKRRNANQVAGSIELEAARRLQLEAEQTHRLNYQLRISVDRLDHLLSRIEQVSVNYVKRYFSFFHQFLDNYSLLSTFR